MNIIIPLILSLIITYPILGKQFYKKENVNGIVLCLVLGIIAYFLGGLIPIIGGPVFGIVIGIMVSFLPISKSFNEGVKITGKKLLAAAIILLGFEMNFLNVLEVGSQSLSIMLITLTVCFVTTYIVSKILKIPTNTSILVGVGTCICGGSAIAATAPVIRADDEEIAASISTIFLFNILAALIFPAIGRALAMTDAQFGIWAGTAINDTSSVVAASYSFSDASGELATIVKLTRTLLIIPIVSILAVYMAKKDKTTQSNLSLMKVFPWFILGFIFASVVNTIGVLPTQTTAYMGDIGKFFIIIAMSAIGVNTDLITLLKNSKKPIILGAIAWFMISITTLFLQGII